MGSPKRWIAKRTGESGISRWGSGSTARYVVLLRLVEPDSQAGRLVELSLTPEEAQGLADDLARWLTKPQRGKEGGTDGVPG